MQSRSRRLSQATIVCLGAAAVPLTLGVLLLTIDSVFQRSLGTDLGPWGANLVVLGAIVGAYGLWISWPHLEASTGLKLSGFLIALGVVLFLLPLYAEPVLIRVVAIAVLLPGLRGAAFYLGGVLPRPRHDGFMSLREKAAIFSLAANGLLVIYLLSKSQTLSQTVPAGIGETASAIAVTAAVVLIVLVAESVIVAFLRRRQAVEPLEDERDAQIAQKSNAAAYAVLVTAVLLLSVQLGIGSAMEPSLSPNEVLGLSSPLAIAHVLLALLFLSHGSKSVAELWQYRQARV
jgi:uncharacterized membrane protein